MLAQLLLLSLGLVVPSLGATLPYIIGGTNVGSATNFPHQCSLQYSSGSHSCGASLISSTWLVTAAHCVGSSGYRVRCGTLNKGSGGQLKIVSAIYKHENYGSGAGSYPNDIAVMRVPAFSMSSTVKAIKMWATSDPDPAGNTDCYITGWGLTNTGGGGGLPTYLQQAKINVYTPTVCKRTWGSSINSGHVCIGDSGNGRGSCNGDSGGPLVCKLGGEYKLVGATSWGINGCYTSYPSVYSRISYFRSWISGKTGI